MGNADEPLPSGPDPDRVEEAIVSELYRLHADGLTHFLIGLLRDTQLAHDVVQSTFAKFVERGHETRPKARKAWLYRVAYHEAMAIRRRQAAGKRAVEKTSWIAAENHEAADLPVIREEEQELVRDALEQLSPDQRDVVRKRIYEGKRFAEIAEELNIPLGTALTRMRSAMAKLKKLLSEPEP